MATTIQLKETTKQLLDKLKFKEKVNSYDEVILNLIKEKIKLPEMFGFTKSKPLKFRKEDELSFNEL